MRKRLTEKLHEVKTELRKRMHQAIRQQGLWLQSVVRGYFNYHAVPDNGKALVTFRSQVARLWYRTLRRRSQRTRMKWERMGSIVTHPRTAIEKARKGFIGNFWVFLNLSLC